MDKIRTDGFNGLRFSTPLRKSKGCFTGTSGWKCSDQNPKSINPNKAVLRSTQRLPIF